MSLIINELIYLQVDTTEEQAEPLSSCLSSDVLIYVNTEKLYGVRDSRCPNTKVEDANGMHSAVSIGGCTFTQKFIDLFFSVILLKLSVMLVALRNIISGFSFVHVGFLGTEKPKQCLVVFVFYKSICFKLEHMPIKITY